MYIEHIFYEDFQPEIIDEKINDHLVFLLSLKRKDTRKSQYAYRPDNRLRRTAVSRNTFANFRHSVGGNTADPTCIRRNIGHGVSFSITHLSPGLNYGLRRCRVSEPVGDYGRQTCRTGRRRWTRDPGKSTFNCQTKPVSRPRRMNRYENWAEGARGLRT